MTHVADRRRRSSTTPWQLASTARLRRHDLAIAAA